MPAALTGDAAQWHARFGHSVAPKHHARGGGPTVVPGSHAVPVVAKIGGMQLALAPAPDMLRGKQLELAKKQLNTFSDYAAQTWAAKADRGYGFHIITESRVNRAVYPAKEEHVRLHRTYTVSRSLLTVFVRCCCFTVRGARAEQAARRAESGAAPQADREAAAESREEAAEGREGRA